MIIQENQPTKYWAIKSSILKTVNFPSPPGVNGIMFSGRQFVICKTEVAFWHVASVGTQSDFLSVYFTGNLFQYQGLYQSVLTLFPMTGMTVPMEPEVMGESELLVIWTFVLDWVS